MKRLLTFLRRSDRAATDPILVIAAIAVSLVLLVGGSFAVAGMINNGKDLNAKGDLDKAATAESAYSADATSSVTYIPYLSGSASAGLNYNLAATGGSTAGTALEKADVGFTPTAGDKLAVATDAGGTTYAIFSKSQTGKVFYRLAGSSTIYQLTGSSGAWVIGAGTNTVAATSAAVNTLLTNAGF
ncbi:hypothetical protein [Curtobacterium sp. MCBD17_040]|uniref:hypothetical protein n=1 Tax=Curtobacterium sp. MCBD17_040 TaxID=2175674 RepID=UPI0011B506E0|nr:hypothetical protein [Curtobacterium sp. MCBD17_040]WIB65629.1 hypothetical protein DEI94_16040 [Curtobacterium sp. MCBD17_040]